MRKPDPYSEIEDALIRLMPVALSGGAQAELEEQLDGLCGGAHFEHAKVVRFPRWIAASGIAAALVLGFVFFPRPGESGDALAAQKPDGPAVVTLNESDRVEDVSDEGLFVDPGGSALRKVRVRVVGESKVRDEKTGIVMTLRSPREEMYLVPVSTF